MQQSELKSVKPQFIIDDIGKMQGGCIYEFVLFNGIIHESESSLNIKFLASLNIKFYRCAVSKSKF